MRRLYFFWSAILIGYAQFTVIRLSYSTALTLAGPYAGIILITRTSQGEAARKPNLIRMMAV